MTLRRRITPRGHMANDSGSRSGSAGPGRIGRSPPSCRSASSGVGEGAKRSRNRYQYRFSCPATVAFTLRSDRVGDAGGGGWRQGANRSARTVARRLPTTTSFRFCLRSRSSTAWTSASSPSWSAPHHDDRQVDGVRRRANPPPCGASRLFQPREPGVRRHQTRSRPSGPPRLADSARTQTHHGRGGERGVENR